MPHKLSTYHQKRNFSITPEPKGALATPGERLRFVVQKHHARRLHYDFRLELDGTLKSWAIPKGPSLDPGDKRLAVHVEDHPLDYIAFEGDIPEHQYGAGHVDVWDTGYWEPQGDPAAMYKAGKLKFHLDGDKLHGGWTLVRTRLQASGNKEQWLLIKEKDETARSSREFDITEEMPDSVLSKPAEGARLTPAALTHAVKKPLPPMLTPQLATLVDEVPADTGWMYEVKFDGYRILARVDGKKTRLYTRDAKDWTSKLPGQARAIAALGLDSAWMDGEIVVLDEKGVPSFQLLQNAFDANSTAQIVFFAFDLPYLNGYDLRETPLAERRAMLQQVLADANADQPRFSEQIDGPPQRLLDTACAMNIEGLIGKRLDSPYTGKRGMNWIKLKCRQRQEFVIIGYTEPQGTRKFFGALLLGVHDENGALHYVGRVGTGFDATTLRSIHEQLRSLAQDAPALARLPAGVGNARTHWVQPQLVAEISFAEWTTDGLLRQAVFHGLRADKPESQVTREKPADLPASTSAARKTAGARVQGVKITNPDRVIDPASGLTKLDLVRYYEWVAPGMLPFLAQRPVYLLRCPEGVAGEHFFQRHAGRMPIPGMDRIDTEDDDTPSMVIGSAQALVGAAQMGTVELHTCNAAADRINLPDCMVFDLDPDPELPWQTVAAGAHLARVALEELGLQSFIKTSGGKGLHIVVPLARRHDWDAVTAFSQALAQHMTRTLPKQFTATMGAKNRIGKIFVDYLRNQRKASTVAPYSARARPGLPVSVPIAWEEVDEVGNAAKWTIATLPDRIASLASDPWSAYFKSRQTLTAAMRKKLGMTPGRSRKN